MRRKQISGKIKSNMLKFWNLGYNCSRIGKKLNVSGSTVRYNLNKIGIRTIRRPRKVTDRIKKKMGNLWESGKNSIEIGKKLGISYQTVLEHLRKIDIDPTRGIKRINITKNIENEMVKLWKEGLSGYKISQKLEIPVPTVYAHLRKFVDTTKGGKYLPGKVTEQMRDKMIDLWKKNKSYNEIAEILGISKDSVLGHLEKLDINTNEHANKPITNEIKEKIKNMYLRGFSTIQIGKELEICDWTVRKHVKIMGFDSGTHPQSPGKVKKRMLRDRIINLWNSGYSSWRIAEELDLAKSSILYNLRKYGIDTSRGYDVDIEILKQKYNTLERILIKLFRNLGFKILRTTEYFKHGADILLKDSKGNVIPVEFKAEIAYRDNFKLGLTQLTNYIKILNAPYGFLVTTANKREMKTPPNIKVIWSNELYRHFPENKKGLDFIRYTPVKTLIK